MRILTGSSGLQKTGEVRIFERKEEEEVEKTRPGTSMGERAAWLECFRQRGVHMGRDRAMW